MNDTPAFPRPASEAHQHGMHKPQEGMTLRDYFAAKALVGLLDAALVAADEHDIDKEDVCMYCYEWADAMMKARETK